MITFEHVSKSYRKNGITKTILSDFSFTIPKGRNLAITGANGAGKSTVLRLIAGIESPDTGTIRQSCRISWPLGFSGGFQGHMTGIENIRFVARIYGANTEYVTDFVTDFTQLGASLHLPVKSYSTGMRARLAFGLSMAIDFDVYLIDEIIAVGDRDFRQKSRATLQSKLRESQIIMVAHSVATLRNYCDCGLLLHNNQITYFDHIADLISAYQAL